MGSGLFHHSAPWRDPWRHDWDFCEQVVPGNKSYCKRSPRLATCESISRAAGPRRLACKFAAITRVDKAFLPPPPFASFLVHRRLAGSRAAGPIVYALLKGCVADFFFENWEIFPRNRCERTWRIHRVYRRGNRYNYDNMLRVAVINNHGYR